jgi:hypothetical protein
MVSIVKDKLSLQQYVISFCETIRVCTNVGLRMGREFDFTCGVSHDKVSISI